GAFAPVEPLIARAIFNHVPHHHSPAGFPAERLFHERQIIAVGHKVVNKKGNDVEIILDVIHRIITLRGQSTPPGYIVDREYGCKSKLRQMRGVGCGDDDLVGKAILQRQFLDQARNNPGPPKSGYDYDEFHDSAPKPDFHPIPAFDFKVAEVPDHPAHKGISPCKTCPKGEGHKPLEEGIAPPSTAATPQGLLANRGPRG